MQIKNINASIKHIKRILIKIIKKIKKQIKIKESRHCWV